MRLGIYGGSFDPVHFAHLLLAETCREHCRLDQVWFVPAASAPHKRSQAIAPGAMRAEMLELAIAGHEPFAVSRLEIDRGGVSYTVDTLAEIHRQLPEARLFLLMGADLQGDLLTWRDPPQICRLATPIIVRRAGSSPPDLSVLAGLLSDEQLAEVRASQVEMPLLDLSSTDLRRRVAEGRSLRFRTPRAVEKYIETHGLYRNGPESPAAGPAPRRGIEPRLADS